VLLSDRFRCDECGEETRDAIWTTPFGGFSPAPPWVHRRGSRRHFCSPGCVDAFAERRRREQNERRRQRRAQAPRDPVACVRCGDRFVPVRSTAEYCSTRCRVAAHRARRAVV
jgi:hypothetical protein